MYKKDLLSYLAMETLSFLHHTAPFLCFPRCHISYQYYLFNIAPALASFPSPLTMPSPHRAMLLNPAAPSNSRALPQHQYQHRRRLPLKPSCSPRHPHGPAHRRSLGLQGTMHSRNR